MGCDNLATGGAVIPISEPIPHDSEEPTIYFEMEETAADVLYVDVVMEIHYSTYLHPVSHATEINRLGTKLDTLETTLTAIETQVLADDSNVWSHAYGNSQTSATIFTNASGNRMKINVANFTIGYDGTHDAYLKINSTGANDTNTLYRWYAAHGNTPPVFNASRNFRLENFYLEDGDYFRLYIVTAVKVYYYIQYREI